MIRSPSLFFLLSLGAAHGAVATLANYQSLPAGPTEYEQYMLELLNRARANPDAEVTRVGLTGGLNEGPPSTTISNAAKQPLAFNQKLITASRNHIAWSLNTNSFSHFEGSAPLPNTVNWTGNNPGDRTAALGYSSIVGENSSYAVSSSSSAFVSTTAITAAAQDRHNKLFIDSGVAGRGHRVNFMNPSYTEVGIGFFTDSNFNPSGTDWARVNMANYDFGSTATVVLTGVAYQDVDGDNFYTPDMGEALGGIVVNAYKNRVLVGTTITWGSGGYSLTGLGAGTYDLEFVDASGKTASGGVVTLSGFNVKADLINPTFVPEPSSGMLLIAASLVTMGYRRRRSL